MGEKAACRLCWIANDTIYLKAKTCSSGSMPSASIFLAVRKTPLSSAYLNCSRRSALNIARLMYSSCFLSTCLAVPHTRGRDTRNKAAYPEGSRIPPMASQTWSPLSEPKLTEY